MVNFAGGSDDGQIKPGLVEQIIFSNPFEVTIGSQTWMGKNLDVQRYRNGDVIPWIPWQYWNTLTTGAYTVVGMSDPTGASTILFYGLLYNWYAVNDPRGLAPEGWHVPSDSEWSVLVNHVGGDSGAGSQMKETFYNHWPWPAQFNPTNSSHFTALPAGWIEPRTGFATDFGLGGYWWTTTEHDTLARYRQMVWNSPGVSSGSANKNSGFAVRCVKD